ncbi:helix-turn-helix domain-containing protein [Limosilactobacillus mucosae]|jgi:transcriptional regulator with XRE-family HTH domain|uniref:HTH-type transcriptional regulator Xre n=1 Tax=Limosilactobacillus mucosae TaxID=97478 RepID=A0A508YI96_LIMMU|nr:helix-turn-helix transcriptional regulator [Limosilactobacillus mucosae]MCI1489881.1 helix-turn-helix domain-containing protein [Limosilactobacillus mucosae]MCI1526635.1 helix-turn-helix domain-containing protein [Limosilactobacillus mucosae]VTZ88221.1 HTH-type transcriptional regulator Xre [Limosilactobacillus mucosae]
MNNIRFLREKNGLTQNDLGRKVGISQQSINNYENERREPKLKTWQKLADYFGVSVPYLQGISAEANPSESDWLIDPHVANQRGHGIFDDELRIKNDSLVDMLCMVYGQYRDTSPDFIREKANLTQRQKKKILDDFSDLLEREITQDLDK